MVSSAQAFSSSDTAVAGQEGNALPVPRIQPVVFEASPGAESAIPVRIFLGTEPAQYRAERVFFYSLARVRNPARRYEVYRMTGLPGFDQGPWRTNFTNYRFAIPDLAGRQGRAIYTDVDEIFTDDPAGLFDLPMGEHGYLAISPQDTAVMLIDCGRMADCWNFSSAARVSKKELLDQAAARPGCWGVLDPAWHARDLEYQHGVSKLLHYTTLHLQPWRPTPDQYSYQIHPYAEYFLSLEQAADREGYETYNRARPSPGFEAACLQVGEHSGRIAPVLSREGQHLLQAMGCQQLGCLGGWQADALDVFSVHSLSCCQLLQEAMPPEDAILASQLELLPSEDVPWVIDRLFAVARKGVLLHVALTGDGFCLSTVQGWRALVRRIARRYPDRCWLLECRDQQGQTRRFLADYPLRQNGSVPVVWVLLGQHAGDNAQLLAIAEALGWPYECKESHFRPQRCLPAALQQGRLSRMAPGLAAPWPDLVLSAGWRTAAVARWIRQQSGGHSRIVAVGRPRAALSQFDLVLTTPQYGVPLRDNVIDLPTPYVQPQKVGQQGLQAWQERFDVLPRPHVALLLGGTRTPYVLEAGVARALGRQASAVVRQRGGSLLVSAGPRTSPEVLDALQAAVDVPCQVFHFDPAARQDNPYPALLALAEAFIVTGESVSMLTEASMTGRPVAFFPLPVVRPLKARLQHLLEQKLGMVQRAMGSRGTPRQQTRGERFYDDCIVSGLIRRGREVEPVHTVLGVAPLSQGLSRPSGMSPEYLDASRQRAIQSIAALITAEHPL